MAAKTSAPFVALLAHFCAFALSQEIKSVAVKSGGDVTLPCMTQEDGDIMIIRWNIPEVNSDEFVFLYHSQTIQKLYMDSKYHNRVELKDPEMKNGDASIVLKNASVTDTGTYECQVSVNRIGRNRRNEPKLTGIVKLQVTDSGHTDGGDTDGGDTDGGDTDGGDMGGQSRLRAGFVTASIMMIVVVVVGLFVARRKKLMKMNLKLPEAGEPIMNI